MVENCKVLFVLYRLEKHRRLHSKSKVDVMHHAPVSTLANPLCLMVRPFFRGSVLITGRMQSPAPPVPPSQ